MATQNSAPSACACSTNGRMSWISPIGRRILRQHAEVVAGLHQLRREAHLDLDAERLGARADHLDRLRMAVAGDDEDVALALRRLRLASVIASAAAVRLVEQRGVGDLHAGEIRDHRLEVDQRFHPALRDLGLVRRVGGVPGGVLEDVAQDDLGRHGAVVALTDEAAVDAVAVRDRRGSLPAPPLRSPRRAARAAPSSLIDAGTIASTSASSDGAPTDLQHLGDLGVVRADVAGVEFGWFSSSCRWSSSGADSAAVCVTWRQRRSLRRPWHRAGRRSRPWSSS